MFLNATLQSFHLVLNQRALSALGQELDSPVQMSSSSQASHSASSLSTISPVMRKSPLAKLQKNLPCA